MWNEGKHAARCLTLEGIFSVDLENFSVIM